MSLKSALRWSFRDEIMSLTLDLRSHGWRETGGQEMKKETPKRRKRRVKYIGCLLWTDVEESVCRTEDGVKALDPSGRETRRVEPCQRMVLRTECTRFCQSAHVSTEGPRARVHPFPSEWARVHGRSSGRDVCVNVPRRLDIPTEFSIANVVWYIHRYTPSLPIPFPTPVYHILSFFDSCKPRLPKAPFRSETHLPLVVSRGGRR